jgi:hypothetical protein
MRKGTSAAAAHVAGGLAVLLQNEPDMKPTRARTRLKNYALADAFTGTVPNGEWGSGKMSLSGQTSTAVAQSSEGVRGLVSAYPNPTRGPISFEFTLEATDLTGRSDALFLRILDVQGREVTRVPAARVAGPQRLTWDGASADGTRIPPGVYLARLEGVTRPDGAVWKFVRMR